MRSQPYVRNDQLKKDQLKKDNLRPAGGVQKRGVRRGDREKEPCHLLESGLKNQLYLLPFSVKRWQTLFQIHPFTVFDDIRAHDNIFSTVVPLQPTTGDSGKIHENSFKIYNNQAVESCSLHRSRYYSDCVIIVHDFQSSFRGKFFVHSMRSGAHVDSEKVQEFQS